MTRSLAPSAHWQRWHIVLAETGLPERAFDKPVGDRRVHQNPVDRLDALSRSGRALAGDGFRVNNQQRLIRLGSRGRAIWVRPHRPGEHELPESPVEITGDDERHFPGIPRIDTRLEWFALLPESFTIGVGVRIGIRDMRAAGFEVRAAAGRPGMQHFEIGDILPLDNLDIGPLADRDRRVNGLCASLASAPVGCSMP